MITKRRARLIREGIALGRGQARFERQYALGGRERFKYVGSMNPASRAPSNHPGFIAYWHTLDRRPGDNRLYPLTRG
ncbi:hypothetical protein [Cryobacterium soli]|uniref:hypothetical protein n=1 Tax=Cryobacterium soli TaxID=2220095 RepID=UPI000E711169|nr:hypothetical protein [Cryobacterium soli]